MEKKIGGGGQLQPYIPKGCGEISGQYTSSDVEDLYAIDEKVTFNDLKDLLTDQELFFIQKYTVYKIGCCLNKGLRNRTLTSCGNKMAQSILNAIRKHKIIKPIKV